MVFTGESMALTCDMREGEYSDWFYTLMKDQLQYFQYGTDRIFVLQHLTIDHTGQYYCIGSHKGVGVTKESYTVSLNVSGKHRSAVHHKAVLVAVHSKRK